MLTTFHVTPHPTTKRLSPTWLQVAISSGFSGDTRIIRTPAPMFGGPVTLDLPEREPNTLDGVSWSAHVEYENATSSRVERLPIEPAKS